MKNDDLIVKAVNGDKSALISLLKQEKNNIYTTLYYLKPDNNDISDIMQNILLKFSSKITTLKNPQYFKTWLNKIIVNSYYDYMRKSRRKFEVIKDDEQKDIADTSPSPLNSILEAELDNVIKKSILNLPNHYKIPIALREIQGLSYEDISLVTNVSIGTVKSRIARARGLIKNEINRYQNE